MANEWRAEFPDDDDDDVPVECRAVPLTERFQFTDPREADLTYDPTPIDFSDPEAGVSSGFIVSLDGDNIAAVEPVKVLVDDEGVISFVFGPGE